jgi:hypothetical protein
MIRKTRKITKCRLPTIGGGCSKKNEEQVTVEEEEKPEAINTCGLG